MNDELIMLSPASDKDFEFSYQVKKAAEGELIRRTFGWDERFQRDFHKKDWTENRPSVIRFGGKSIGTIAIIEGDGYIEVGQFFILPEYQNRGIGSTILRRVLQKADKDNIATRLAFLRGNRAATLYQRNGFQLVMQTETHCYMERRPQKISQQPPERDK